MSKVEFRNLLVIYRSAEFSSNGETACLDITTQEQVSALSHCLSSDINLEDSGVSLEVGDPDNLAVGGRVVLKLGAPRSGLGKLAKSIGHLIEIENSCIEEPKRYFIIDDKFSRNDISPSDKILRYRKILSFVDLVSQCAAYVDKNSSELIFIHAGKFIVPVKYTWNQIEKIDLAVIDRLLSFFNEDTHKEQKISILTNTVVSLVEISAVGRRFSVLLTEVDDLLKKFSESYKIFIADFSYDKVRSEFEEFRLEYAGKIHKVFSDIQNQLLTIPVATVVVATSMKATTTESLRLSNIAILLGSWVFAILFTLLCVNQWKTLGGLKKDIDRQKKIMEDDYPTISPSFEDIFTWLERRVKLQYGFLAGVLFIIVIGLISSHYFYCRMKDIGEVEKNIQSRQILFKK